MRKLLMVAVLALLPVASQAQFSLGLRVGYAPAMGDVEQDSALKDGIKSQIPLQLDAMYKVTPDISVGAYFSYGFGQAGDLFGTCDISGVDCSASSMRYGVQAAYAFNKASPTFVPWAGLGFGYESSKLTVEGGGAKVDTTLSGWEYLNLQAGGDYKVNENFVVGPYLQLSVGQYGNLKVDSTLDPTDNFDGSVENKATHEWFGFGIRGKFDL